jgi:predicted lipoprotein
VKPRSPHEQALPWRAKRRAGLAWAGAIGLVGLGSVGLGLGAAQAAPQAAVAPPVLATPLAFPYYRAEHALQGLYGQHHPPLWQRFEAEAGALTLGLQRFCAGQAPLAPVQQAWRQTRLAWLAAATPALGPVLTRRSQRELDFWPLRPALLQRALAAAPATAADLVRVGGPAKGLPALEWLLGLAPTPTAAQQRAGVAPEPPVAQAAACRYASLAAAHLVDEARALQQAFASPETLAWQTDEDAARQAFAQWINQWLGGLEALRWQQIEQPLHKAKSAGAGHVPVFARAQWPDNLADWQVQWQALLVQARLPDGPALTPPVPGRDLVPIEALLIGKGQLALATRWRQALDSVTQDLGRLTAAATAPQPPAAARLMALSAQMKQVTALYQQAVAPALDVPLGFSSADGD